MLVQRRLANAIEAQNLRTTEPERDDSELAALRRFRNAFHQWRKREVRMHDLEVIDDEIADQFP